MAIEIKTSKAKGYRQRTIENASAADVTVAIACDLYTAGEILTRNAVLNAKKIYIPVKLNSADINKWSEVYAAAKKIVFDLRRQELDLDNGIKLNIAGNGLATFPSEISQEDIDLFVARTLLVVQHETMGGISQVRSGGQTGIDEAGVKAADILGIKAVVNGPADFCFRIRSGSRYLDIKNQNQFVQRFDEGFKHRGHLEPIRLMNEQLMICPKEVRSRILKGESYEITPGNFVEFAQNTEGIDRLWVNDSLFEEHFISIISSKGKDVKYQEDNIYYRCSVSFSDYGTDDIITCYMFVKTIDEAERQLLSDRRLKLNDGSWGFPEINSVMADMVFVGGNGYKIDEYTLLETERSELIGQLQKKDPDVINIWYSSNENADLSNFALRPFKFEVEKNEVVLFQSVEQAFQYMKTLPKYNVFPQTQTGIQHKILNESEGSKLRHLGRQIKGLDVKKWDSASNNLMKNLIRASFEQNPEARKRLISTGNVNFIHHQEKGSWRITFPMLLNSVRYSLQKQEKVRLNYHNMSKSLEGRSLSFYEGDIKPSKDIVFVFGSNVEGRHGLGSAKTARELFGARYGQGEGLQGSSYAIPTKDLRVKDNNGYRSVSKKDIINSISAMYRCAEDNPNKVFMVAYRNQPDKFTLSGYRGSEMISMFLKAGSVPANVRFSAEWKEEMIKQLSQGKNTVLKQ